MPPSKAKGEKAAVQHRNADNQDKVTEMLHKLQCNNVSVSSCFHLGKVQDNPSDKAKPVKIILTSEAQMVKILQSAKKLERAEQRPRQGIYSAGSNTETTRNQTQTNTFNEGTCLEGIIT